MSRNTKISIIMPLYNAQKYLEEAIESLLNQTHKDFELLCINDCSTDETGLILDRLSLQDNRIRIFNNAIRQGAAISRNLGIEKAEGKYIIFLDGDDLFDTDLLKASFLEMERTGADIVMFEYMHVDSEDIHIKRAVHHGKKYIDRYCRHAFEVKNLNAYEFLCFHDATWNKLYRKSFIDSSHLKFQNLESSNDVFFSLKALLISKKTILLDDQRVMVYARDHNEPSRISKHRDPMCAYAALEYLLDDLLRSKEFDCVVNHYFYRMYFTLKAELFRNRFTKEEEKFYDFLQKEGIRRLCSRASKYYQCVDEYIQKRMSLFLSEGYQTRWYEDDNLLDFYLREKEENVKSMLKKYQLLNKKIGVWGAGRNGKSLIDFCNEQKIRIDAVIDSDLKKEGMQIGGYPIYSPRVISEEIDVVIITGVGIAEKVKEYVENIGWDIELEDINKIVGVY